MELQIREIAERIRALRDILDLSEKEMAEHIGCTIEEYKNAEQGETDFSFTFIYKCAEKFYGEYDLIQKQISQKDIVVYLGAGSISSASKELIQKLKGKKIC